MELEICSFELAKMLKEVGCYITNEIADNGAFAENTVQFYNDSGYLCTERCYNNNCCNPDINEYSEIPAPSLHLAQMWFREVHGIFLDIKCDCEGKYDFHGYDVDITKTCLIKPEFQVDESGCFEIGGFPYRFNTYNQALSAGLKEACKLILKH